MEWISIGLALAALAGVVATLMRLGAVQTRIGALVAGESALAEIRAEVAALRSTVVTQLATMQQSVTSQVGDTRAAISDVRERLGAMREQSREIADLARNVGTLQDLLRPPKLRGGVGELLLERILEDILPGRYERQFEFPSTRTRVDAVVRIGDKLVPIDAKFPLDMYVELTNAAGEERKAKRRAFVAAVKRHVDQVAEKYIVPRDGTIDFAFAYIPSEAVYYELTAMPQDGEFDLRTYCADRGVLPVSPNTLQAFLAAVHLGLRGLAIQDSAKEIQGRVSQLGQDLARLDAEHDTLGRHLDNARGVHLRIADHIDRMGERLRLAGSSLAQRPEQPPLALNGKE